MSLTLKKINDELQRLGREERLEKGDGYFYFWSGETADWLDRTVKVPTVNSLTLEQWVAEYEKLKQLNHRILNSQAAAPAVGAPSKVRPGRKSKK